MKAKILLAVLVVIEVLALTGVGGGSLPNTRELKSATYELSRSPTVENEHRLNAEMDRINRERRRIQLASGLVLTLNTVGLVLCLRKIGG